MGIHGFNCDYFSNIDFPLVYQHGLYKIVYGKFIVAHPILKT
jgi:hypothetical protein